MNVKKAVDLLKKGEVVALPTETVYGLAGDALNENAVRKIFEIKGRPFIDPLIVHVSDWEKLHVVAHENALAKVLGDAFWPGPLTLILKKKPVVPDLVTAGMDTVAIRMPKHMFMRAVLQDSQLVLAAPSANPFGYVSPTRAEHVRDSLGDKIALVCDAGPCEIGIESTIVDLSEWTQEGDPIAILRPGPIQESELESVVSFPLNFKKPDLKENPSEQLSLPTRAPGMMNRHYSPKTPIVLWDGALSIPDRSSLPIACIYLKRRSDHEDDYWLSESGDLNEVAQNLFHLMRIIDKKGYAAIYIEKVPQKGIGIAINDRLKRAASKV